MLHREDIQCETETAKDSNEEAFNAYIHSYAHISTIPSTYVHIHNKKRGKRGRRGRGGTESKNGYTRNVGIRQLG